MKTMLIWVNKSQSWAERWSGQAGLALETRNEEVKVVVVNSVSHADSLSN